MPKLIILRGEQVERELDLGTQDLRIGRGAENDLTLEDPTKAVSRFHAEIRPEAGGWVLIDLNSQNGTWIDGRRVQKTVLTPGVTVSLGPYHLKYEATVPAAPTPPMPASPGVPVTTPSTTDTIVGGKMRAPVQPISTKPVVQARPPAKPIAKAKGARPATDDNLISRLVANKPLLFGGFGAFMVLIIVAGQLVGPSETPATGSTPATPAAQAETPAPAQPSNAEIIAKHLEDGKALLAQGDAGTALREHFEQVLLIEPNQPEATELKLKAEEMLRPSQMPSTPTAQASTPVVATPAPAPAPRPAAPVASTASTGGGGVQPARQVDNFGIARNPGESQADWRSRSARMRDRYNEAKAALQRNDFDTAIAGLEGLDRDQPDFQDVRALLTTARAGLKSSAQDVVANAARLEKNGDYLDALTQLNRAKQLDASINIDDSVRRIRQQILKDADDAYSRARVYDARGRMPEAVALYERVVQLLPPDHPNRRAAQDRLGVLRSKPQ